MSLFLDIWTPMLPLIGVGFGWSLNEWSKSRSLKKEHRKPFGRALAYLLNVHLQLIMLESFRRCGAKSDSELAKKMMQDAKLNQHSIAPTQHDFEKRFNDAVDQIAEISPFLASDLRMKMNAGLIYKQMSDAFGGASPEAHKVAEVYGDATLMLALPVFESLLLEVAKQFSREEHQRLGQYFKSCQDRLANVQGLPQ